MVYVYGTDEFKVRLARLKYRYAHYYDCVFNYFRKNRITISNDNHLVLIGIWKDELVFRLRVPENEKMVIIKGETPPENGFWCNSETREVQRIMNNKNNK